MGGPKVLVITSGGFDPIHDGHIEYLKKAKALYGGNTHHVCIVNNEKFLIDKKGYAFYSEKQRLAIISELKCVDEVFLGIDFDGTVCMSIAAVAVTKTMKEALPFDKIVFAKGGDRFANEIPEASICERYGIEIVDGLGDKIESSSKLVEKARGELQ